MARRASSARPILCAVLDGAALSGTPRAARETAAALFAAGVDWIQLRDRSLGSQELFAIACALVAARDAARKSAPGPRVIVNKRSDIALAAGADGVHLGMDAADARSVASLFRSVAVDRTIPDDFQLGASLHSVAELEFLIREGLPLTYVQLAPIWSPRSKPAERSELGLAALALAAELALGANIELLAQGGLDAARATQAIRAGATGIAVTGSLSQASDPAAAARSLRRALDPQDGCESETHSLSRRMRAAGEAPR